MTQVSCSIAGLDQLERGVARFEQRFSASALTARTLAIAAEAGEMLKEEVVAQLVKLIYSQPAPEVLFSGSGQMNHGDFGDTAERTGDLHDAHTLKNEGLLQSVEVDMERPVSSDAHSGRETIGDYALAVHDGYMQYVPLKGGGSRNTWTFHPGRPWMEEAYFESYPLLIEFVQRAFLQIAEEALNEVFA